MSVLLVASSVCFAIAQIQFFLVEVRPYALTGKPFPRIPIGFFISTALQFIPLSQLIPTGHEHSVTGKVFVLLFSLVVPAALFIVVYGTIAALRSAFGYRDSSGLF